MNRKLFKIGKTGSTPLPKFSSRRFGGAEAHFKTMAFKSDGGEDPEAAALMEKIKTDIIKEVETRGYQNGASIEKLITKALDGLSLEALRSYGKDKEKFEENIRNLDAELKKVKAPAGGEKRERTAPLKDLLDKNWDNIAKAMRSKSSADVVTLTTRAAATMTMGDAIDETALDAIGQEIIESFSVDSFVKKRRPVEYIWEVVNRRTVPELTEYKTWLEEGGEEGAFAIVEEGAVKPLMSKGLIRNVSKYKKVAGKRVYNEEFAKFRKEAYRIIEDLFNDQIMRNYNALITADVIAKAAAYVGTALDGQYANPTDYHAIGAVAAQVESLDFFPDLLLINPQDKWRIGLSQNDQGTFYMNVPAYNPNGEVTMLGFRVFTSNRIDVGTAILGESRLFKVEDEPLQLRLGYGINVTKDVNGKVTEVESDIDHNRFRIIAETFYHSYIATNHIGSFVKFNFADMKAALQVPGI